MKILVWAPPFQGSAGVRVLHRLCHLLRLAGHEAYISTKSTNPDWNTPYLERPDYNTVVIYPEIAMDQNPLNARLYVAYCLNRPGALGGTLPYKNGQSTFCYHEMFLDGVLKAVPDLPLKKIFTLGIISRQYFFDDGNRNRTINACWVYKGAWIRNLHRFPGEESMMMLTFESAKTYMDLGNLLRSIKTLYSYDHESALLIEAKLCGCEIVVMTPEGEQKVWNMDEIEVERHVADDERDVDLASHFVQLIKEDFQMAKKHEDYFVAIYTNKCKSYCDERFFKRLAQITAGTGVTVSIVDNSVGLDYTERLKTLVLECGFEVPVEIEHIDVKAMENLGLQALENISASANHLRDKFLKGSWTNFVILETDIIPERVDMFDLFDEVLGKADIIGGIYYWGFHKAEAFDPKNNDLHYTHHALSGVCLYKRAVIKKIAFRWSADNLGAFPDAWICYDTNGKFRIADHWGIKCEHLSMANGSRGWDSLELGVGK